MPKPANIPHETVLHLSGSHGVALILRERHHQLFRTEYTVEHDDTHTGGELRAAAAACLMATKIKDGTFLAELKGDISTAPAQWPWDHASWRKISRRTLPDLLAVAGAFIAAEIDRQFRAEVGKWMVVQVTSDCWWLARSIDEAVESALASDEVVHEEVAAFTPRVLTQEEMYQTRFVDDSEDADSDGEDRAFQEEFERRIAGGPSVEMFAMKDCV